MSENGDRPELPEGWEWSTLGDLCDKPQYGYTTKAAPDGTVQFLRTTDISKGSLNWDTVPYCAEEPKDVEKYRVKAGDILIARSGSVGLNWLLEGRVPDAVFASYLIRFRPKPGGIEPRFLRAFLQSPMYWSAIADRATGIGMTNVNAKKLATIPVPVPPLEEQQQIVSSVEGYLGSIAAADEFADFALEHGEDLRRAILHRAFSDSHGEVKSSEVV